MECADVPAAGETEEEQKRRRRVKWLPLESNPEALNGFIRRVGVEPGPEYNDVLGLHEDLLFSVPQPVIAVTLLFPSKAVRRSRDDEPSKDDVGGNKLEAPESTFYLTQHKDFGNACGTIGAVHVIGNLFRFGRIKLRPDSPIHKFVNDCAGKSPDQIGWDLCDASDLHEASESAAKSEKCQTRTPGRNDKVDCHFIAFVEIDGRLVELDGCRGAPIDHGPTCQEVFLQDCARVIQEEFMARAPGDHNFSVLALSDSCSSGSICLGVGVTEEQIQTLTAMGFAVDVAKGALEAAGGDMDMAVGILCG